MRRDIQNIMAQTDESFAPIAVTNIEGKLAVLIGKDVREVIEETLHFMGIPGTAESFIKVNNAFVGSCVDESTLER